MNIAAPAHSVTARYGNDYYQCALIEITREEFDQLYNGIEPCLLFRGVDINDKEGFWKADEQWKKMPVTACSA
jgi:hypothetical protein